MKHSLDTQAPQGPDKTPVPGVKPIAERIKVHLANILDIPAEEHREILALARASLAQCLEDIESCVAERDWSMALRAAHTLKGTLRSLGLNELAETARQMEQIMRQDHPGHELGGLGALKSAMADFLEPGQDLAGPPST